MPGYRVSANIVTLSQQVPGQAGDVTGYFYDAAAQLVTVENSALGGTGRPNNGGGGDDDTDQLQKLEVWGSTTQSRACTDGRRTRKRKQGVEARLGEDYEMGYRPWWSTPSRSYVRRARMSRVSSRQP